MFEDSENGEFYTKLEHWGFWTCPNDAITVYEFPHGPDTACFHCKLNPAERGDHDERCTACREADETKWARDTATRRTESEKAMRHLRHARKALERMAKASSSTESKELLDRAGYCHATEITLDYWRDDYRGGREYHGRGFQGDY